MLTRMGTGLPRSVHKADSKGSGLKMDPYTMPFLPISDMLVSKLYFLYYLFYV